MKYPSLLIAVLCLLNVTSSAAEPQQPVPRLTGHELVERYFKGADVPISQRDAKALVDRELALGYGAGVADATQGNTWCDTSRVKTIEIDSELAHEIRKLSPTRLRQDAASLIIEILKIRFPCR